MFNILLMVAGVLEYVLLGIQFHVSTFFILSLHTICHLRQNTGQFPEYIPRRNLDLGRVHQCLDRFLPDPKIGGYSRFFPGHDPTVVSGCSGWYNFNYSSCRSRQG